MADDHLFGVEGRLIVEVCPAQNLVVLLLRRHIRREKLVKLCLRFLQILLLCGYLCFRFRHQRIEQLCAQLAFASNDFQRFCPKVSQLFLLLRIKGFCLRHLAFCQSKLSFMLCAQNLAFGSCLN
ncbi:MAG: hypothetical protein LUC48_07115 [Clostridiales bacterium]|nr:hypothetical protein [Clostridiales bacterium]